MNNETEDDWVPVTAKDFLTDPRLFLGMVVFISGLALWAFLLLKLLGDV